MLSEDSVIRAKQTIRQNALQKRQQQPDRLDWSRLIVARAMALPEFQQARTVMLYLNVRTEVETLWALPDLLNSGKKIVVPYCRGDTLAAFHLTALTQLTTGRYGIQEPLGELRTEEHEIPPDEIETIWVPGVAFDSSGGRLGYGAGYYDHFLPTLTPQAAKVGLCYACQLVSEVPRQVHDCCMDYVITEEMTYPVQ